jgi:hypothetical protein
MDALDKLSSIASRALLTGGLGLALAWLVVCCLINVTGGSFSSVWRFPQQGPMAGFGR